MSSLCGVLFSYGLETEQHYIHPNDVICQLLQFTGTIECRCQLSELFQITENNVAISNGM